MSSSQHSSPTSIVKEIWKPIPRETESFASSLGRIREGAKLRKATLVKNGRMYCTVGGKFQVVHRLVARAFIGECPDGMEVNHIDGNPKNNHADNLEYLTPQDNVRHASRLGLLDRPCKLNAEQFATARQLVAQGISRVKVATLLGVSHGTINFIVRGLTWKEYFEKRGGRGCKVDSNPPDQRPSRPAIAPDNSPKNESPSLTKPERGRDVSKRLNTHSAPCITPNDSPANDLGDSTPRNADASGCGSDSASPLPPLRSSTTEAK